MKNPDTSTICACRTTRVLCCVGHSTTSCTSIRARLTTNPRPTSERYAEAMDQTIIDNPSIEAAPVLAEQPADELLEELLIEEISIDGMCGVY